MKRKATSEIYSAALMFAVTLAIAGPITGFFVLKKRNDITWHTKELEDKIKQFISKLPKKEKRLKFLVLLTTIGQTFFAEFVFKINTK